MSQTAWFLLAGVAAIAAVAFAAGLGVPRERPPGRRGGIVRWGHALVWVLLAAVFLGLGLGPPADALAAPLGLLALAAYLGFLGALLSSGRP